MGDVHQCASALSTRSVTEAAQAAGPVGSLGWEQFDVL